MDRAALRSVALRIAALAMLLLLVLVAVLTTRTMNRLPDATLYWIRTGDTSFALVPRSQRLGSRSPEAYATAAIAALAAGPDSADAGPTSSDLTSAVPPDTEVVDARLDGTTLIVELSPAFATGGGTASMRGRLEQVLWTLSQPGWAEAVELRMDGVPLRVLGGEGLVVPERWTRPVSGALPRW